MKSKKEASCEYECIFSFQEVLVNVSVSLAFKKCGLYFCFKLCSAVLCYNGVLLACGVLTFSCCSSVEKG
jgi:hypothetical protein